MAEHQRTRVPYVCLTCGEPFMTRPDMLAIGLGRYCSAPCARKKPKPPAVRVEITCPVCRKVFLMKPCEVGRGGGKYCSRACFHVSQRIPVDRQFLDRLGEPAETGCILWLGNQSVMGYGLLACQTYKRKRLMLAHRFSFEMAHGEIPQGMQVRHLCEDLYLPGDVTYRRCVNPLHLGIGDHADNMADKVAAGRQVKGEGVHSARMTAEGVRSLRRRYAAGGVTQKQLSEEHEISVGQVIGIIKRRSWKHVT